MTCPKGNGDKGFREARGVRETAKGAAKGGCCPFAAKCRPRKLRNGRKKRRLAGRSGRGQFVNGLVRSRSMARAGAVFDGHSSQRRSRPRGPRRWGADGPAPRRRRPGPPRRDAGGDYNGAALSQERTGAGVRGAPPVRPLSGSGAEGGGFEGGAQHPLARAQCLALGRLAYAQVACRLWRSGGHLRCSAEAPKGAASPAMSVNSLCENGVTCVSGREQWRAFRREATRPGPRVGSKNEERSRTTVPQAQDVAQEGPAGPQETPYPLHIPVLQALWFSDPRQFAA